MSMELDYETGSHYLCGLELMSDGAPCICIDGDYEICTDEDNDFTIVKDMNNEYVAHEESKKIIDENKDYIEACTAKVKELLKEELKQLYINELNEQIKSGDVTIRNLDNNSIRNAEKHIKWVDAEIYNHHSNTVSAEHRIPAYTFLCYLPVGRDDVLVLENCEIENEN